VESWNNILLSTLLLDMVRALAKKSSILKYIIKGVSHLG
jgi:hypothetical protein